MNLYIKEMKFNLKSFLIWSLVFILFLSMYVPMTDLILDEADAMLGFLDSLPKFLVNAFNLDKDLFTKPEGIFGGEGMSFIYILGAIFIASMVGNIFAKEYENKTIEYLIVKPLSRKDIFIQKLLCLISYTILLNLIFTFVMLVEFKLLVNYPYNQNVLIAFGYYSFVSQFFFLGISMISSIFFQKSSMNTLISLAVVIFMYFGNTLAKMSEKLILISRMSIYNYIPITDTIIEGNFYYLNGLFIIFISLILMAVSYLIFIKKDIKID